MSAAVCAASADVGPNTVGTSTVAFSSTMFAVEKSPTVQPARVNGTHGAGVTRFGVPLAGTVSEYTIEGAVSVMSALCPSAEAQVTEAADVTAGEHVCLISLRRRAGPGQPDWRLQAFAGAVSQFTIHGTPNLSTSMPKPAAQKVGA